MQSNLCGNVNLGEGEGEVDKVKSLENDLNILEERVRNLQLSNVDEGNLKSKSQRTVSNSSLAISNQNDIRNALRSIESSTRNADPGLSQAELLKVHELLKIPLSSCGESENEVSNVLNYLKLLCDVSPPLPQPPSPDSAPRDDYWQKLLEPICPDVLNFMNQKIFHRCLTSLSTSCAESNEESGPAGQGTGFAFHQQLGVLLKGLRIYLIYLKRATTNLKFSSSEDESGQHGVDLSTKVKESLNLFCALLNPVENKFFKLSTNFDVGLDIRCNIGVGICYSLYYIRSNDKVFFKNYFKSIFSPAKEEKSSFSEVEMEVLNLTTLDVNRIALAFAILNTWLDTEYDSDLYYDIGRNILDIQHGVKEAVNLGSARVLEIWANNLARNQVPSPVLHHVSTLFPSLEFFCFMYMPGHIDAVKNCCRNIISALALIYDRLDEEVFPTKDRRRSWVSRLVATILEKPAHIKWLALACVCRNTKKSISVLEMEPSIAEKLLTADGVLKLPTSDAYVALMSYHFELSTSSMSAWEKTWIDPLFTAQVSPNNQSNWQQKRNIISTILHYEKLRSIQVQPIIRPLLENVIKRMNQNCEKTKQSQSDREENIAEATLLAAETIKLAHELHLTIDNRSGDQTKSDTDHGKDSFRGLVSRSVLHQWLWSENSQVRLAGLALLVETKKTSEVVSGEDLESLKIFLKYNLLSQNPSFRQQFISYFKKLVRRLKDSLAFARRKKDNAVIESYENILRWLWQFLSEDEGLFYGANFGRRCQALECLSELTQAFPDFQVYGVSDTGNIKYLRWLKDTFENNKNQALEILVRMPMKEFQDPEFCQNLFDEALNLCKSVKPPDSVTGRYLMTLLMRKSNNSELYSPFAILEALYSELEVMHEKIKSTSLVQVSSESPLYGCVRCIRMILESTTDYKTTENVKKYRDYVNKLLKLCFTIDDLLFPVLGNAAPEGFIPGLKDSNPDENKQVVRSLAAQILLVCAWRTMKEICLLMSDMCSLFVMEGELFDGSSQQHLLTFQQVSDIGDHLLHLLKNLMHRGVFEQVYVGFKQIANRLWQSPSRMLCNLPEKWLQDAMDQEHISAKSITRRSGGLPFIFQALLSAESDNEVFLQKWIQRLLIFDESPEMIPIRIHSMNVLRGLFRDACFSAAMMPFVPHGLRMAFRGLKSLDWTERNSGLMLYGAVMRRSFGPKLNLMNAPTFFRKFPQMYDFLLEEIDTCINLMERRKREQENLKKHKSSHSHLSNNEVTCDFTFHLLLLLSSFTPSVRVEDTHFKLESFLPKIRKCGQSDDMEVRKLSAKALVPFLTSPEEKRDLIGHIFKEMTTGLTVISQNHLHGLLCQLFAVADSLPKGGPSENKFANAKIALDFLEFLSTPSLETEFKAPSTFSTVMDILAVLYDMKCVNHLKLYVGGIIWIEKQFVSKFKCSSIPGNVVPGLPVSFRKIANTVVRISADVLDDKEFLEKVYNYFTDPTMQSRPYIEQVLVICSEEENYGLFGSSDRITDESLVVIEAIISSYLRLVSKEFRQFPGTEFELAYLSFMGNLPIAFYEELDSEIVCKLISRLIGICEGDRVQNTGKELTTLSIKSNAFRVIGKVSFASGVSTSHEVISKFCDLALDWSASDVDDDLREAVAESYPIIPFQELHKFSALNQAKLWASIFLLAQDDESYLRQIINMKLDVIVGKPCCDRKSLEILTRSFCKRFLLHNPIEGIVLLIGLLLREDFEVEAKAADDETEDRLFDKSEMNTYFEHITLAKTIKSELEIFLEQNPSFKLNLNTILTENQTKFYLQLSNQSSSTSSITDISIRSLLSGLGKIESSCNDQNNVSYLRQLTKVSDSEIVRNSIKDHLCVIFKLLDKS